MMKLLSTTLLCLLPTLSFAWNGANNPANFGKKLVYHFQELPLSGKIQSQSKNWPGYHWPNNKKSINNRWTVNNESSVVRSPSLKLVSGLSRSKLNELSPAEKFDIYLSRFDYPTVAKSSHLNRVNAKDWNGICHGLAAASRNHEEPKIKTVTTQDGIELSFFSSDLKALLAFEYASRENPGSKQIGKRCFFSRKTPILSRRKACSDIDAGSFHLIMTNFIGLRGISFIADLDRYKEVWNHPITSFESRVLERSNGRVKIETTIVYPDIIFPQYGPVVQTSFEYRKNKTYHYYLDLNSTGKITGGKWISKYRPDFIWLQEPIEIDEKLKELL